MVLGGWVASYERGTPAKGASYVSRAGVDSLSIAGTNIKTPDAKPSIPGTNVKTPDAQTVISCTNLENPDAKTAISDTNQPVETSGEL